MVLWLLLLYHGGASILILTNQKNGFLTVIVETRFFYFRGVFAQPLHYYQTSFRMIYPKLKNLQKQGFVEK